MMNTINKIFSEQIDDDVHAEFIKYSRGIFENKYLLIGKKQKENFVIKTGNEFANYFVKYFATKLGENSARVKGIIVSTRNLKEIEDFRKILGEANVKQFMGIKQFQIDKELKGKEILRIVELSPASFFALSFNVGDSELKIKPKPPRSAKPSTSTKADEEGPKIDFCSVKTSDREIVKDLFFDFPEFNEILIKHTVVINQIELPKGVSDPAKMRELAKRKGILKREIEIDGKKILKEKEFIV